MATASNAELIETLPAKLFIFLRKMDTEAAPLPDGSTTGLRAYYAHVTKDYAYTRGRPWENAWSDRLATLLQEDGWTARRECRFADRPDSRERCDLLVGKNGLKIWLEVKGAWHRLVDDENNPAGKNGAYLKHLVSAGHDIDKLEPLLPAHADAIGFLLISFHLPADREHCDKLDAVRRKTKNWHHSCDRWDDRYYPSFEIACHCWVKSAKNKE